MWRRWTAVLPASDLKEDEGVFVEFEGRPVLLYAISGRVYAADARCPHRGSRLLPGLVAGSILVCPSHGWSFCARTGRNRGFGGGDLRHYAVRVRDGRVEMKRSPGAALSAWLARARRRGR